ncbi:putative protein N(5)-glutamine methyltransferase [Streptomyces sp. NPDC006879]|uniref:putative protein N(5)-glutamine methyltransferase n=1 Tax=Streptomyces sp. NPDC006879 TaxID=3364767 RepID=UPI003682FE07
MTEFDALVGALRAAGCVFAEEEARLLTQTLAPGAALAAGVRRRVAGEPLEHVLGWAEFCGVRLAVDPGVFVPRVRTEFLVRQAGAVLTSRNVLVDLCCGAGAVGAVLAGEHQVELHAVDLEPAAVRCARRNLAGIEDARAYLGDLYAPLPTRLRNRVDVLVANAPYVPTQEIPLLPPEARLHEPRVALDGGVDGLRIQRRVTAGARQWLAPGGHLLIETSGRQAEHTASAMTEAGLARVRVQQDEDLGATVVIGTAP